MSGTPPSSPGAVNLLFIIWNSIVINNRVFITEFTCKNKNFVRIITKRGTCCFHQEA